MTVAETITIPADRRLHFDFEVPFEIPVGTTARLELVWPVPQDDVYAGLPSKLDDDLLRSQLDVLEKADW